MDLLMSYLYDLIEKKVCEYKEELSKLEEEQHLYYQLKNKNFIYRFFSKKKINEAEKKQSVNVEKRIKIKHKLIIEGARVLITSDINVKEMNPSVIPGLYYPDDYYNDYYKLYIGFTDALNLIKKLGGSFVLSDDLLKNGIIENPGRYNSRSDFVLIHKTDYIPNGNRLSSCKELNLSNNFKIDKIGSIQFKNFRNTVHFAVNGEVSSHDNGNWDEKKYAIIIPFDNVNLKDVGSISPVDLYVYNGINLSTDAYILCPINEVDIVKNKNPNVNVVGYEGRNVTGFANYFISLLGYKRELIYTHKWGDYKDENNFLEMVRKESYISDIGHFDSDDRIKERFYLRLSGLDDILDKCLNGNLTITDEAIDSIIYSRIFLFIEAIPRNNLDIENLMKLELGKCLKKYNIEVNDLIDTLCTCCKKSICFDKMKSYFSFDISKLEEIKTTAWEPYSNILIYVIFSEVKNMQNKLDSKFKK